MVVHDFYDVVSSGARSHFSNVRNYVPRQKFEFFNYKRLHYRLENNYTP